jgi:4a-hydroxytetrahydrobiopterin dehydratase
MSEQGWRVFLDTEGVEDWVVLRGDPTAVLRTETLAAAAGLANAVARIPGLVGTREQLTVGSGASRSA